MKNRLSQIANDNLLMGDLFDAGDD